METTKAPQQIFATYSEYTKQWLKDNHIKVKTAYIEKGDYDDNFVYLNRVANSNPNKSSFRVLIKGKDVVKNCIKITFDTDKVDKNYIEYFLKSRGKLLNLWAHGSCQRHINCSIVGQILSGVADERGPARPHFHCTRLGGDGAAVVGDHGTTGRRTRPPVLMLM